MKVTFENYQELAHKYANYENDIYPYLGLQEEIGEAIGKIAKSYRGDKELDLEELKKELGDCLWMQSEIHTLEHELGYFHRELKSIEYDVVNFTKLSEKQFLRTLVHQSWSIVFNIINYYDLDLLEILQMNIDKLEDRFQRGVIQGDGDNR